MQLRYIAPLQFTLARGSHEPPFAKRSEGKLAARDRLTMVLEPCPVILELSGAPRVRRGLVSGSKWPRPAKRRGRLAATRTDGHCGLESGDDGRESVRPSASPTVMHDT